MTPSEIVDSFIAHYQNPVLAFQELIGSRADGFKYVYTGDDHYLVATREQAETMLTDILNIRVEIDKDSK